MSYTSVEYTDIIIAYGMAGENARAAARLYAERFLEREWHPNYKAILCDIIYNAFNELEN